MRSGAVFQKIARRASASCGCRTIPGVSCAFSKPKLRTSGTIPTSGIPARLQPSLSYVDILVISTITPAMFVAKREVKSWPVFGMFAKMGGTLFRGPRTPHARVGHTTNEIQAALDQGA